VTTLFQVLERIFSNAPAPTGNPDVDEVRLYNFRAQACTDCGAKPAHRHGDYFHCDACCLKGAQAAIAAAEMGPEGVS
jgi:hypothetical protein